MILRRAVTVVVLTLAAIFIHELGHYVVYRAMGCPVTVTLQSVRPAGMVRPGLDRLAKLAGPAVSLVAGAVCLLIARKRPAFAWVTASFTNASLRLFPLMMDVDRAIKRGPPFSDEGEVAYALAGGQAAGRLLMLVIPVVLSCLLTGLAAKQYRFRERAALKVVAIYVLSLAVGIAVVLADELTR